MYPVSTSLKRNLSPTSRREESSQTSECTSRGRVRVPPSRFQPAGPRGLGFGRVFMLGIENTGADRFWGETWLLAPRKKQSNVDQCCSLTVIRRMEGTLKRIQKVNLQFSSSFLVKSSIHVFYSFYCQLLRVPQGFQ